MVQGSADWMGWCLLDLRFVLLSERRVEKRTCLNIFTSINCKFISTDRDGKGKACEFVEVVGEEFVLATGC